MTYIVKLEKRSVAYKEVHGDDPEHALKVAKLHHTMKPEVFTWKEGEVHAIDVDLI